VEQIDDRALPAVGELPQEGLAEQGGGPQVDRQGPVPARGAEGLEAVPFIDRGIVDEQVERSKGRGCLGDQLLDCLRIGKVGLKRQRPPTRRFDPCRQGLGRLAGAVEVKAELVAIRREGLCHGMTDPLSGAGKQDASHSSSSLAASARSQGARPLSVWSRKSSMLEQRPSRSQRAKTRFTRRLAVNSAWAARRTSGSRSNSPSSSFWRIRR